MFLQLYIVHYTGTFPPKNININNTNKTRVLNIFDSSKSNLDKTLSENDARYWLYNIRSETKGIDAQNLPTLTTLTKTVV